jgi:murein DD-endopeptidase MepM/ murein hydrolase activator NlpD
MSSLHQDHLLVEGSEPVPGPRTTVAKASGTIRRSAEEKATSTVPTQRQGKSQRTGATPTTTRSVSSSTTRTARGTSAVGKAAASTAGTLAARAKAAATTKAASARTATVKAASAKAATAKAATVKAASTHAAAAKAATAKAATAARVAAVAKVTGRTGTAKPRAAVTPAPKTVPAAKPAAKPTAAKPAAAKATPVAKPAAAKATPVAEPAPAAKPAIEKPAPAAKPAVAKATPAAKPAAAKVTSTAKPAPAAKGTPAAKPAAVRPTPHKRTPVAVEPAEVAPPAVRPADERAGELVAAVADGRRPRSGSDAPRSLRRRPSLYLAAALVGTLCVSGFATGGPEAAATTEVSHSVSIAQELGITASPSAAITDTTAAERLGELAVSRAERGAEQAAAAQAQVTADQAATAAAAEAARPRVVLPVAGARLTSTFGARWGTMHAGIDLAAPMRTPEMAAMDGVVLEAGPSSGFGLAVYIQHENGDVTVYGHMDQILVQAGQVVKAGDVIALLGNRGQSTGPHLHFEVHVGGINGQKIDPLPWLRERGIAI